MDSASIVKRTLDYQKTAIDAGYNTMVILQGHAEKMATDMWERSNLPKDSIKAFATTVNEYKKRRDDMKKMVDDGFDQFSKLFTS
ncbi:hypothetical protein JCM14469_19570 [Desulfatiferula olefinivorans]